ncbi:MAG: UPF0164 family protein [Treponema sp.]|nr:UPF0164 family protein [Treponema sp.]
MKNFMKVVFLAAFLIFFSLFSVWAFDENLYGDLTDFLNNIYGVDKNAGLTAFPVLNIPFGGRSEGMAGAFAAVSDDVSFLEFNPAGSSMLEKSELAFFHNNWIADTNIEAIAYANRFGDLGFAFGAKWLYTPFTEYNIYGERVSSGYYSEGVIVLNASYNLFSGYYFNGLSVGMNFKGAFRIMPDYTDSFDEIIIGSGDSQSAFAAMVDIGALTRFDLFKFYASREKNASAAFVIRNLGPPVMDDPLPTVINAAISYKPIRPLLLAFDFNIPVNLSDFGLSELPYAAFGLSANITDFLTMRSGFMIKAGSSRFNIGSAIQMEKIALDINYSLDLLTQLQPLNRISLGVRLDLGDDNRKQTSDRVDELYLLGLEAYSRGNFTDARLCWEEAVRLNPRFDPAIEGLVTLDNREALMQRVEDLHRLDF